MTAKLSPDCRAGKCAACVGQAWDDDTDEAAACPCACHFAGRLRGEPR